MLHKYSLPWQLHQRLCCPFVFAFSIRQFVCDLKIQLMAFITARNLNIPSLQH